MTSSTDGVKFESGSWKCDVLDCLDHTRHWHTDSWFIGEINKLRAKLAAQALELEQSRLEIKQFQARQDSQGYHQLRTSKEFADVEIARQQATMHVWQKEIEHQTSRAEKAEAAQDRAEHFALEDRLAKGKAEAELAQAVEREAALREALKRISLVTSSQEDTSLYGYIYRESRKALIDTNPELIGTEALTSMTAEPGSATSPEPSACLPSASDSALAAPRVEPIRPPWYDHGSSGIIYKKGSDPEVNCPWCHKTFLTDPMDACCRMCQAPYDKTRCDEFGFTPRVEPAKEKP